jgi:hypothetical protein
MGVKGLCRQVSDSILRGLPFLRHFQVILGFSRCYIVNKYSEHMEQMSVITVLCDAPTAVSERSDQKATVICLGIRDSFIEYCIGLVR